MTRRDGEVRGFGAGELVLSGDPVLLFAKWLQGQADAARRGGLMDADLESWADVALDAAARTLTARRSEIGTSDVPIAEVDVVVRMLDPVDAREAARILGCGERNVVALVHRNAFTSAQRLAGRHLIERSEVLARAERTT